MSKHSKRWNRKKRRAQAVVSSTFKSIDDREVGKYTSLSFGELLRLDELISGDYGRRWEGRVEVVYEAAATAYTPAEISTLLKVPECELDDYLEAHWVEHDIQQILDETIVVQFQGEGVLLSPTLNESAPSLCRLFTPTPGWKPVRELEACHAK